MNKKTHIILTLRILAFGAGIMLSFHLLSVIQYKSNCMLACILCVTLCFLPCIYYMMADLPVCQPVDIDLYRILLFFVCVIAQECYCIRLCWTLTYGHQHQEQHQLQLRLIISLNIYTMATGNRTLTNFYSFIISNVIIIINKQYSKYWKETNL